MTPHMLRLTTAATFTDDHLDRMYGYAPVGETVHADDGPLPDTGRAVCVIRSGGSTVRADWTPTALADLASDALHYADGVNGYDAGLSRSARAVLRALRRELDRRGNLPGADAWAPLREMLGRSR